MDYKKELPKRKHPRLDHYDYSSAGAYFVTICTQNRRCVLSRIVGRGQDLAWCHAPAETGTPNPVGRGQDSAETDAPNPVGRGRDLAWRHAPAETDTPNPVGRGRDSAWRHAPAETDGIEYTAFGKIAEEQLLLLEDRYPCLSVDKYVIMPNHIHVILILESDAPADNRCYTQRKRREINPRPTIMDVICAYKSLTARECKKAGMMKKLFQTSFYEHVIRGREDYEQIVKYIYENPIRWYYDELYTEE